MPGRVGSPSRPKIQAGTFDLLVALGGADALPRNPTLSPLCPLTRELPLPRPSRANLRLLYHAPAPGLGCG